MTAYSAAAFVAMMILNYFYNDTGMNDVANPELTRVLTEPKVLNENSVASRPNNNEDTQVLELNRQEKGFFGGLGQMFKSEWRYYLINSTYLTDKLTKQKKSISQNEVVLLRVTQLTTNTDLYLDVYMRRKAKPTERVYDFKESTARYPTIHIKLPSLRHNIEWFVGLTPATGVSVFKSLEYTIDIVVVQNSNTYNPTTVFTVFTVIGLVVFSFVALCFFGFAKLKSKIWNKTSTTETTTTSLSNSSIKPKTFVWLRTDNELIPLSDKEKLNEIIQNSLENLENPIGQKSEDKSKENKTDSLSQTSNHNNKTPKKSNITLGRKASSEALRRSPREKIISEEDKNENTRARRSGGSLVKERIAKFESLSSQNK